MKLNFHLPTFLITALAFSLLFLAGFTFVQQDKGYVLDHEKDIAVDDVGPHNGGGKSTAYPFFGKFKGNKVTFRKRILHPGSSIGYHLQEAQEIYYILNGNGELQMNGKTIHVTTGDGILTLPGSSHGIKPAGNEDLSMLIVYQN
ncbi:MAG: cupin protein [Mucilaginibacter sp.]|uniref:cupin domain-containing protein n=1 Tax=Mucilaginibacter sp. TaxID=1882438 RepID=UPI00262BE52F|nr:cupin domain-containing protein [Mucilaginibacter sp.]MDB5003164.1 cupin protein [Mucilaginibacter sp.]